MSDLTIDKPKGILREGWHATVSDYAISGGWARSGNVLVVGDSAGGIFGFEGTSGKVLWQQHKTHGDGLLSMAIHPDGNNFASAGQDGRVLVSNAKDGALLWSVDFGKGWVENVSWSPDGKWLAVSISRRVHVYNVKGQEVWKSDDHPSTVSSIAWSGSQELATACYGRVTFFGASNGEVRQKLEWRGSLVSMVLSPNGDIVACGSQDNSVHFWRRSTGQDSMMQGYPGKPAALAFDDSGILLATGGSKIVLVWSFEGDGPEGTRPGVLEFHVQPITTLTFAPSGTRLASGARDGAVVIWSLKSNGEGGIIGGALVKNVVSELIWRPDGRGLVALDSQGGVTAWRVRN